MESVSPRGAQQLGHHLGIQRRAPRGDPLQGLDEVADVGHPVLEQIADPRRVVGQELGGVAGLDVLREQQDAQTFVATAQLDRGPQSLVGEGRRHADVDHRHVRPFPFDRAPQGIGVRHGVGDGEPPVGQKLDEAVAEDGRVFGDDDAQRAGSAFT